MTIRNVVNSNIKELKALLDTSIELNIPVDNLLLHQLKVRIDELIEINGRKNSTVKAPVTCPKCNHISTYV
jgi:hypothetical protein